MFVLTVDQVDSQRSGDLVDDAIATLMSDFGDRLLRPPKRTAGDEFQTVLKDAYVALDACLQLTRRGNWSVGCGIGSVDEPLPHDVRAGSGPAFVAARRAVDSAKKSVTRCAVRCATNFPYGDDIGPLLDLLVALRARRTTEGWEVHELVMVDQLNQRRAAEHLGISEQAVSARIRAAEIRIEDAARSPLARLMTQADRWKAGQT